MLGGSWPVPSPSVAAATSPRSLIWMTTTTFTVPSARASSGESGCSMGGGSIARGGVIESWARAEVLSTIDSARTARTRRGCDSIIDVARVDAALQARGAQAEFDRLLRRASIGLALTFIVSAPVNFLLALYVLKSPPGTPAFNAELGKMHWVSLVVIALPSMVAMMAVFWKLMNGLARLSGLTQEEIFREGKKESAAG